MVVESETQFTAILKIFRLYLRVRAWSERSYFRASNSVSMSDRVSVLVRGLGKGLIRDLIRFWIFGIFREVISYDYNTIRRCTPTLERSIERQS